MTIRPTNSPATNFSVALLEEFVRLGVRDVVLSPGSRSQALALAAAEFEKQGLLRLRVRIDERVGAFLALGLAVETGSPVLVVTTSGTAVANLHPAVLEAHHSAVPLIIISADRPDSLRGIGSNQTTQQPGIFGTAVHQTWDVEAPTGADGEMDAAAQLARDAVAAVNGPVHLNLSFDDPLSAPFVWEPGDRDVAPEPAGTREPVFPDLFSDLDPVIETTTHQSPGAPTNLAISPSPATVVIAGTGAGPRAEQVARELGAPLIAEVASGAHFGPNLVVAYRELLNAANFGDRVARVIVFGHPTLSREIPALIQRRGVQTIVVRHPSADDYNPGRCVRLFVDEVSVSGEATDRAWLGRWVMSSRQLLETESIAPDIEADAGTHAKSELAIVRTPVDRRMLAEAVWRATWPHDRLVLGASRLIREVDRVVPGKKISVHSNRGLAGIDGTISTALGIALASQAEAGNEGVTRVLLGDLAIFHDVGALMFGVGEPRPRIQVIVGNDNGGTIFDGLEVASQAGDSFDRVLLTQQNASIEALAVAYGWRYVSAATRGELDQALSAHPEPTIIEVPLGR
ncbi:2-succinyl-5-enolpyruvyl-6-hydroxy-3-cyclohexene-1-carboxylic-acid synthase [Salinibacterium sp. NSLL150]|uniref:2-succinyl-5-enolpyruvyl-6-hydroxy-3- cyclohexene-1-carboxylic-acid synthase n=1 Tax=unclassified Salinibacterium TaxID=2632331 RepID=UPI0018CFC568|nr:MULTISPECIES: 2-succinyl-5-enolpyruvyl-6-hydroxy-3-cyclohexene-1-carboxylic-acid synthase [unclassified Salinibacterium]MBH0099938.1 2-succinyl-5-enolpyruvyl-6-hydroxy-3-cyclohexene-1-carboxylic-acid synthase [Salinibacterium sp. NSLL35]MBH0102692.1 2-succinyl-5-enolpyruvyl-6-hydroxy-3-cyclohexene-1-carboxylic-acid synthase [Salinibacterium sp. NSLL150]MBH0105452.1 2-succinyl-5-enolpyruvyl-6-hydroxy-3-cyclohexene-1-carboxylic-acid synthase [Salinibacterium sp. NSLL16]MBH0108212.1 2-succinyl-